MPQVNETRNNQEMLVSTRTKTLGVAAAITAALVAVPTAVQAYAAPTPTTPTIRRRTASRMSTR